MAKSRVVLTHLAESPEEVEEFISKKCAEMGASGFTPVYVNTQTFPMSRLKRTWESDGVEFTEEIYSSKYLVIIEFEVAENGGRLGTHGVSQSRSRGQAYSSVCP